MAARGGSYKPMPGKAPLTGGYLGQSSSRDGTVASPTIGKSSLAQALNPRPMPSKGDDYANFLNEDPSGVTVIASAIEDMTEAAKKLYLRDPQLKEFPVVFGNPIEIYVDDDAREDDSPLSDNGKIQERYPPPSKPEWQKKIGDYQIWLGGHVTIQSQNGIRFFHINMTITAEPLNTPRFKRSKINIEFDAEIENEPGHQKQKLQT